MNEKQKIKNELEMARNAVKEAGLFLVSKKEIKKMHIVIIHYTIGFLMENIIQKRQN